MRQSAFCAYPGGFPAVRDAMHGAAQTCEAKGLKLELWETMRVVGFKLDDLVRNKIEEAPVFVADITYPNANVFYELGYAIALGKAVLPAVNVSIERAVDRAQKIGLFDTLGWAVYQNSDQLADILLKADDHTWVGKYTKERDYGQPLFVLDTLMKTDFRNHIFHAIENSKVEKRTFDPAEVPRLTASQAISEVSSSAGIIVSLIDEEIKDGMLNNQRAAFIAGLSHGYGLSPLIIQYNHQPVALDYRDFVRNSTFRRETEKHVEEYCLETLIRNQQQTQQRKPSKPGILNRIDLGSPAAENETQHLNEYFIQTAEYSRAVRAEAAIVVGRKGSGKSAVFMQVSRHYSRNRENCIVDLRPASHNLSEMREALVGVISAGAFDHTVAAFWQYILYVEILLKIREMALPKSRNNFNIQEKIRKIEEQFSLSESVVSGDFTSRLETAVRAVLHATSKLADGEEIRRKLTNAMFEEPIHSIRQAIIDFNEFYDEIIVLVDDLDKGWPPKQVEDHDILTVKHLVESLNRIQRDLKRKSVDVKHLVFLRSDIYEKLVSNTSDRGKYNPIRVDWSDIEQLRFLLRQRVVNRFEEKLHDEAWAAINPPGPGVGDTVDRMIESSLRRPRFLIDLCERTLSFAINRGHSVVTISDVDEGIRQMSLYLVSDFAYELRDFSGTPEDIFYRFVGKSELFTLSDLKDALKSESFSLPFEELVELLLWYGFLGVVGDDGKAIFIYDRAYDFRRLQAERPTNEDEELFAVNPAFLRGLSR